MLEFHQRDPAGQAFLTGKLLRRPEDIGLGLLGGPGYEHQLIKKPVAGIDIIQVL